MEIQMSELGPETLIDVRCPNCATVIPVTEALQRLITEHCEIKIRADILSQEKSLTAREAELRTREESIQLAETQIETRVKQSLENQRAALEAKMRAEARE